MKPTIELAKPRSFSEIINDTFVFVKLNFKPLMKCFFMFCGFFLLVNVAASVFQQIRIVNMINNINASSTEGENPYAAVRTATSFGISQGALFITTLLYYATMMVTVLSYLLVYKSNGNRPPQPAEVWGYIKYFYLRVLGGMLLIGLAFALMFGLFYLFGRGTQSLTLVIFGILVCITIGIWLSPVMSILFPVMVLENTTLGYAFSQSFKLLKEYWWVTFGALFVMGLIVYVCVAVAVMPSAVAITILSLVHAQKGAHLAMGPMITTVVMQQLSTVFYLLLLITAALCYFNLNEIKEGTAMLDRIQHFGEPELPAKDADEEQY